MSLSAAIDFSGFDQDDSKTHITDDTYTSTLKYDGVTVGNEIKLTDHDNHKNNDVTSKALDWMNSGGTRTTATHNSTDGCYHRKLNI